MEKFFKALAGATCTGLGEKLTPPEMSAQVSVDGMEVSVDLGKFIDIPAEIARNEKLEANIVKQIAGKESKLSNATFVDRAPADVVAKERESLEELRQQLASVRQALERLRAELARLKQKGS
jgi:valyl-tRNA synthetase